MIIIENKNKKPRKEDEINTKIRIAGVANDSIVDGPGLRYTVFFQGCSHACPKCHNPQTWDFRAGTLVEISSIIKEIRDNPLLSGVTLSGGDPFQSPRDAILFANAVKNNFPNMDIWMYTGYKYEELCKPNEKDWTGSWQRFVLLKMADVLVDGPYVDSKRDLSLSFRGSRNQRLIDVSASLKAGRAIRCNIPNKDVA